MTHSLGRGSVSRSCRDDSATLNCTLFDLLTGGLHSAVEFRSEGAAQVCCFHGPFEGAACSVRANFTLFVGQRMATSARTRQVSRSIHDASPSAIRTSYDHVSIRRDVNHTLHMRDSASRYSRVSTTLSGWSRVRDVFTQRSAPQRLRSTLGYEPWPLRGR